MSSSEPSSSWVKDCNRLFPDRGMVPLTPDQRNLLRAYRVQKRRKSALETTRVSEDESIRNPRMPTTPSPASPSPSSDSNGYYAIPKWLIRGITAVAAIALPWAFWNTVQLEVTNRDSKKALESISSLTVLFSEHVADNEIHHAALRPIQHRLKTIEGDIEDIEKELRAIRQQMSRNDSQ